MKWWNGGSSEEKQTFRLFQSKNINIEEYLMKAESWRCNGPVCLYAYVPAEGSRTMCFYIYYYFSFLYGERQRQTFAFGQIYNSLQLRKYMFKTKFHNNNKYLEDSEWVCFVWKHWIYCIVYTEAIMHLFPNSQMSDSQHSTWPICI